MDEYNDNPDIYFPEEEWGIWDNQIKNEGGEFAHDFEGNTLNYEEIDSNVYPNDRNSAQRYFGEDEDPYGILALPYQPEFGEDYEPWNQGYQYPNEPVEQVEANDSQSEYDKKENPSLPEIPMDFPPEKFQKINYNNLTFGESIGTGAFAKVYKGTLNHPEKPLEVAIKKLTGKVPSRVKKEFRNEAKIMSQLDHYAIVKFYGLSLGKNKCLVMELLSVGSLCGLLKTTKISDITWPQRYRIAKNIIEALSYLHEKKIWHRDIKSDNILLNKDDSGYRAKLADFGLSHESLKTDSSKHLSAKMSVESGGYDIGTMLTKTLPTEAELLTQKKEAPILIKVQEGSENKATFYVYGISRDGKPIFTELNNSIEQLDKLDFDDETPLHFPSRNEKKISDEIINKRAHHKQYVAGTMGFIAPEILKDKSNPQYSEKSDIYAYGMLLWEMATHLKPFFDLEKNAIESKTINNEREKVPEDIDDKRYGELIRNCWEADPKTRPTTQKIKETVTKLMENNFPHPEGSLKVSVFEKKPIPSKKQRNQNDLSKPPKLKLRIPPQSEISGSIVSPIDKPKNITAQKNTQLSAGFHPVHAAPDIQNSAVTFFLSEGSLKFQNWYHPDVCHYLLQMTDNKVKCVRVFFHDANEGNNTKTFKNQLLQLVMLSNWLKRPALFISKEPGADNHFISGLVKEGNLLLINPLGMIEQENCYQTLAELKQEKTLKEVWISSNALQKKPYEAEGLVSCGPVTLELATHILSSFTPEDFDTFWGNYLKTDEPIKHHASELTYYGINIKYLLPESLKGLTTATDKSSYESQVCGIRQKHCRELQALPLKHANNLYTTIEDYLSNCKEGGPHQLTFNALITEKTLNDIDELAAYQLLKQELNTQAIKSIHSRRSTIMSEKYSNSQIIRSEITISSPQDQLKSAVSNYELGNHYYNGTKESIVKDYKIAVKYYQLASDQEFAKAQYCLGECYENGKGVEPDHEMAVRYYELAADQGYAEAQYALGICYGNGEGIKKNELKAVDYLVKAANQGLPTAQCSLGICYDYGIGVRSSEVKAFTYYSQAAEQKLKEGKYLWDKLLKKSIEELKNQGIINALLEGNLNFVKKLKAKNVLFLHPNEDGLYPLVAAVYSANLKVVKYVENELKEEELLKQWAMVDVKMIIEKIDSQIPDILSPHTTLFELSNWYKKYQNALWCCQYDKKCSKEDSFLYNTGGKIWFLRDFVLKELEIEYYTFYFLPSINEKLELKKNSLYFSIENNDEEFFLIYKIKGKKGNIFKGEIRKEDVGNQLISRLESRMTENQKKLKKINKEDKSTLLAFISEKGHIQRIPWRNEDKDDESGLAIPNPKTHQTAVREIYVELGQFKSYVKAKCNQEQLKELLLSQKCINTLQGDNSYILDVAVLPNNKVVTGSDDKTLKVWYANTGKCLITLNGHSNWIRCVAVLPSGHVVSGSDDKTLKVWDTYTGECLTTLNGHKDWIRCIAVLSNGHLVSGSDDKTLKVWDANTGKCLATLNGHSNWIRSVAVLPNAHVVSGSDDKTLKVWSVNTGECVNTLEGHSDAVNCVAVLPNGQVISGSDDKTLKVWDAKTGECVNTLEGHSDAVNCVAVLPNGQVISGSGDKTLKVWDATTGQCLSILKSHNDVVSCIAVFPDGKVISGSNDTKLKIWKDLCTEKSALELSNKKLQVQSDYIERKENRQEKKSSEILPIVRIKTQTTPKISQSVNSNILYHSPKPSLQKTQTRKKGLYEKPIPKINDTLQQQANQNAAIEKVLSDKNKESGVSKSKPSSVNLVNPAVDSVFDDQTKIKKSRSDAIKKRKIINEQYDSISDYTRKGSEVLRKDDQSAATKFYIQAVHRYIKEWVKIESLKESFPRNITNQKLINPNIVEPLKYSDSILQEDTVRNEGKWVSTLRKSLLEKPFVKKVKNSADQEKIKIVLMGAGGVGMSALVVQYTSGVFIEKYDPTIEETYTKPVEINRRCHLLEIIDTAGIEQFTAMRDVYMKHSDVFILVYSIVSLSTFYDIQKIHAQIIKVKDTDEVPILIVGNKCDLEDKREVTKDEGEALARGCHAKFIETSAKTNFNVDKMFYESIEMFLNQNRINHWVEKEEWVQNCELNKKLYQAVTQNHTIEVQQLIQQGANLVAPYQDDYILNKTLLDIAGEQGNIDMLAFLLSQYHKDGFSVDTLPLKQLKNTIASLLSTEESSESPYFLLSYIIWLLTSSWRIAISKILDSLSISLKDVFLSLDDLSERDKNYLFSIWKNSNNPSKEAFDAFKFPIKKVGAMVQNYSVAKYIKQAYEALNQHNKFVAIQYLRQAINQYTNEWIKINSKKTFPDKITNPKLINASITKRIKYCDPTLQKISLPNESKWNSKLPKELVKNPHIWKLGFNSNYKLINDQLAPFLNKNSALCELKNFHQNYRGVPIFPKTIKIALMGSGGVGMNAIITQFTERWFLDKYDPRLEETHIKPVEIDGHQYTLKILHTTGTEQFSGMRDLYIKRYDIFILVFSITAQSTFHGIPDVREQILRVKDVENVPMIIVGNKCDLEKQRAVTRIEAEELARKYGALYIETSAKENINVDKLFYDTAKMFLNSCMEKNFKQTKQGIQIKEWLDKNRELNKKLYQAVIQNHTTEAQKFIQQGVSLVAPCQDFSISDKTLLDIAAEQGDNDMLALLLSQYHKYGFSIDTLPLKQFENSLKNLLNLGESSETDDYLLRDIIWLLTLNWRESISKLLGVLNTSIYAIFSEFNYLSDEQKNYLLNFWDKPYNIDNQNIDSSALKPQNSTLSTRQNFFQLQKILPQEYVVKQKVHENDSDIMTSKKASKTVGNFGTSYLFNKKLLLDFECQTTLKGHSDSVTCVAVLSNGKAISASSDKNLKIWDIKAGQCLNTLKGHSASVTCVAVLSNGKAISASDDKTLKIWDTKSGECLNTLKGHTDSVTCVAALPDSKAISASDDETLKIWDTKSGECLNTLKGHTDSVTCVAVLSNDKAISASDDETLKIWDIKRGRCLNTLKGYNVSITCIEVLSNGNVIVGADSIVIILELATGKYIRTLHEHSQSVNCIAMLSNGNLISGSDDKTLKVWDLDTGECVSTFDGHSKRITSVAVLANGKFISVSADNTIKVWNDKSQNLISKIPVTGDSMKHTSNRFG